MSEDDQLQHMNLRLLLILGYAMAFVMPYGKTLTGDDKEKYRWLVKAVENVVYLDKPLPEMP